MTRLLEFLSYIFFALLIIGSLRLGDYFRPYDSCDSKIYGRCGMQVKIDYQTGCHYLRTYGGLTPRLNASGTHVCSGAENKHE